MIRAASLLAIALLLLTSPGATASAQSTPGNERDRFGQSSPWATLPDEMQTEDLVPPGVLSMDEPATVDLRCRVGAAGTLISCHADWESVHQLGLCQAALLTAARAELKDHFPDGESLEGLYAAVTMVFAIGEDSPHHRIFPHLSVLSKRPLGPIGHPLASAGQSPPSDCTSVTGKPT